MTTSADGALLRIFVGESDKHGGKPLYEWIVHAARAQGLAGATVVRGLMGYGVHSRMHTFKVEVLSLDLPIIVEIVDVREKLESFLTATVEPAMQEGVATLEAVRVFTYRRG